MAADKTPVETAQEAYKLGKKLKRGAAVVRDLLNQVFVMADVGVVVRLRQRGNGLSLW